MSHREWRVTFLTFSDSVKKAIIIFMFLTNQGVDAIIY